MKSKNKPENREVSEPLLLKKNKSMKTIEKRFRTLELINYRMSNSTKVAHFDTEKEAVDFAKKQKELHPRTKKLTGTVWDSQEKRTIYC